MALLSALILSLLEIEVFPLKIKHLGRRTAKNPQKARKPVFKVPATLETDLNSYLLGRH
jgi:hypothetical protein